MKNPFESVDQFNLYVTTVLSKYGDNIFIFYNEGIILGYDVNEKQSVLFQVNKFPWRHIHSIRTYTESLVSI